MQALLTAVNLKTLKLIQQRKKLQLEPKLKLPTWLLVYKCNKSNLLSIESINQEVISDNYCVSPYTCIWQLPWYTTSIMIAEGAHLLLNFPVFGCDEAPKRQPTNFFFQYRIINLQTLLTVWVVNAWSTLDLCTFYWADIFYAQV